MKHIHIARTYTYNSTNIYILSIYINFVNFVLGTIHICIQGITRRIFTTLRKIFPPHKGNASLLHVIHEARNSRYLWKSRWFELRLTIRLPTSLIGLLRSYINFLRNTWQPFMTLFLFSCIKKKCLMWLKFCFPS